ncbi:MAG: M48 family metallopeptidase [Marinifilum sp.]|jgi:predicted metal-dependent hydrolase|nr:M48 family metallopeptidase [Marinifilum sp.]
MPTEKIVHIKEIGEISLRKDKRFKRLSIRMAPTKGIWINLPFGVSYDEGIQFAIENKSWILQAKHKKEEKENQQITFNSDTKFRTKYHELKIRSGNTKTYSSRLNNGFLEVIYPQEVDVENEEFQTFIRESIIETLRREAKYYLPKRLAFLAKKYGFIYKSVQVKNTKSRWGSCSHDNKINLSLQLMRLPEELSDMVILHELCHTKIKNHSSDFWELLSKHCPNLQAKKNQIKKYSLNII